MVGQNPYRLKWWCLWKLHSTFQLEDDSGYLGFRLTKHLTTAATLAFTMNLQVPVPKVLPPRHQGIKILWYLMASRLQKTSSTQRQKPEAVEVGFCFCSFGLCLCNWDSQKETCAVNCKDAYGLSFMPLILSFFESLSLVYLPLLWSFNLEKMGDEKEEKRMCNVFMLGEAQQGFLWVLRPL